MRQILQGLPGEMRSHFMRDYPVLHQRLRQARLASVLTYVRLNVQRDIAEDLYQPQLDVEQEAQQWFAHADTAVPGGVVTRRLQEAAPYY